MLITKNCMPCTSLMGVLCGVVSESHWWDVWWAAGESGRGLWVLVLCLSFPVWGPACMRLVGLGLWNFLRASFLG